MEKVFDNVISTAGRPVAKASIAVTIFPSGERATIYSDDGITTRPNPIIADDLGYFEFYAATGRYTLTITGDGIEPIVRTDLPIGEPGSGADVLDTLAKADGAKSVGFGSRTVEDKLRETVSPADFGAVGDGVADDMAALMAATATGKVVDGRGLTYGVAGNFQPPSSFAGLENMTLKQLTPTGANRRTLFILSRTGFSLYKVYVNRNGNLASGFMNDDAGIWISGCSNFTVEKIGSTGGGGGNGVTFQSCHDFEDSNVTVHDERYTTATVPPDDVVNGIWYNNCYNFTSYSPYVYDCGCLVAGVVSKRRSRGIAISGCYNFTQYSPRSVNVDQGHDITGGVGNHDFTIDGGVGIGCYSYSFKAANSAYRGRYVGCTGDGAGLMNFVVSGPSEAGYPLPRDITYKDCRSIDAGREGGYVGFARSGFRIQSVPTVDVTYPRGVIYDNCQAIDTQAVPTMDTGFASDVIAGTAQADINRLVNGCKASGFASAATTGFNEANCITGANRVDGTAPRATMYESGAAGNKKMWDTVCAGGRMLFRTRTDTDTTGVTYCYIDRTGAMVDKITWDPTVTTFGGINTPTRYLEISNQGAVNQRFDDNGAPAFRTMANYGLTGAGQGAGFVWNLGTGGAFAASAARLRILSTDTWAAAANRSAKLIWELIQAGAFGPAMEYDPATGLKVGAASAVIAFPNGITKLQPFTIATLPNAATYQWGVIAVTDGAANKRLAISDGTNWRWPDGAVVS